MYLTTVSSAVLPDSSNLCPTKLRLNSQARHDDLVCPSQYVFAVEIPSVTWVRLNELNLNDYVNKNSFGAFQCYGEGNKRHV